MQVTNQSYGRGRVRGFHKFNPIFKLSTSLTDAHKNFKTFMLTGDTGIGKSLFIQLYVVNVLKLKPLIIYHYHTYDTLRNFNKEIHNRIVVDYAKLKTPKSSKDLHTFQ